jgi:sugar porter (SP) family MFS transporter
MSARELVTKPAVVYGVGALGALLFGYDNGIIAAALLFIEPALHLTPVSEGVAVSAIVIGAMIGAIVSGPAADRVGRRVVLLLAGIAFTVGAIGTALAGEVGALIAFRVVLGLGIGIASVTVPLFLAEMAPARSRGVVTSLNQYLIVVGASIAAIVGYALSFSGSWRLMLGLAVIPSVAMLVGLLVLPDTPRSLVRRGDLAGARQVLENLRGDRDEAERECADIERIEREDRGSRTALAALRESGNGRILALGIALALFQQVTGINAFAYYQPTVLHQIGLSTSESLLFGVGSSILSVIGIAIVVQAKIVDRYGRKPLLLGGLLVMVAGLTVLAIASLVLPPGSGALVAITMVCFLIYTTAFNSTWGPVLWVVLAEIFPLRIRGMAMGIAALCNWIAAYVVSLTFPGLLALGGPGPAFLTFAIIGALICPVLARILPETHGRSLEDVERQLKGVTV